MTIFFGSYTSNKIDFFDKGDLEIDFKEQIRILIGSISDDDDRNDMFKFWQKSLKNNDYNDSCMIC